MFPCRPLRTERVTKSCAVRSSFPVTCVAFSPAAQLQAVSAERATLGVGGGADAAAAGGGARELPAGPASVQLASPVRANPAPPPPSPVPVPWEIPPSQCTGFSTSEEPLINRGNRGLLGHTTAWQGGPGRKVFQEMPASPADSSLLESEVTCSPQGRGLGVQPGVWCLFCDLWGRRQIPPLRNGNRTFTLHGSVVASISGPCESRVLQKDRCN